MNSGKLERASLMTMASSSETKTLFWREARSVERSPGTRKLRAQRKLRWYTFNIVSLIEGIYSMWERDHNVSRLLTLNRSYQKENRNKDRTGSN